MIDIKSSDEDEEVAGAATDFRACTLFIWQPRLVNWVCIFYMRTQVIEGKNGKDAKKT